MLAVSIDSTYPKNSQGITFTEDQAGYLAGVLAGALTSNNKVGVMGNLPIPPVQKYVYGFLHGVRYVNPLATVHGWFNFDVTWNNMTLADMNAKRGIGSSAIYQLASVGKWVMGVDTDESVLTFANKSDPASNYIITSAVKRLDKATEILLQESVSGYFFSGNKVLDATVGGVGISPCSSALSCKAMERSFSFEDLIIGSNHGCTTVRKTDLATLTRVVFERLQAPGLPRVPGGQYLPDVKLRSNGSWTELTSFGNSPAGLQSHTQTFLYDNTFLLFGGINPSGSLSSELWRYDYDQITWTLLKPNGPIKPPPLEGHASVFQNTTSSLIVFGGRLANGTTNRNVYRYALKTNSWDVVTVTGLEPRSNVALSKISEQEVYVWGGRDESDSPSSDLHRINLDTFTATRLQLPGTPGIDIPDARFGSTMASINGTYIYLYGGSSNSNDGSVLWRFDIKDQRWRLPSPAGSNPPGLTFGSMVRTTVNRVVVIGGKSGAVSQRKAYAYAADLNAWVEEPQLDLPIPLTGFTAESFSQSAYQNACNAQDGFMFCVPLNDTVLVMYGGLNPTKGVVHNLKVQFYRDPIPPRAVRYPNSTVASVSIAVASIGIIFGFVSIVALLVFWKREPFRTNSPIFLCMYAIGSTLSFAGLVIYCRALLGNGAGACGAALWVFGCGFMLLVSAICVKNWQIYYILKFSKSENLPFYVKDYFLASFVAFLVACNAAVIAAFSSVAPFELNAIVINNEDWPTCKSRFMNQWLWILLSPPASVILTGLFISSETRILTARYNEPGLLNLSLYILSLTLVVLVAIGGFLQEFVILFICFVY
ncbi:hypothetical protein HDU97_002291 [Phlyctochytrium planicorne]|nr:hypothetical protein HDU97_002291 [Phlyctochytrium planicorne]